MGTVSLKKKAPTGGRWERDSEMEISMVNNKKAPFNV